MIRADLAAAPVAESARDLSSPRIEEPSDTGCLPRGWPYVVINQKVRRLRARYVSPEMTGESSTRMSFVSLA